MVEWKLGGVEFGWPVAMVVVILALFLRSSIVIGLAYMWVRYSKFARRHRVYRLPYRRRQIAREIRAGVLVILTDATVVFFSLLYGVITLQTNPGPAITAFSFLVAFLWAEVWFYAIHRAFHDRRFYWIHRQHHVAKVADPVTAISFSVIERLIFIGGLVGFLGLLSLLVPLSRPGILSFGVVAYVANVLGHLNVEIVPAWFAKSRIGGMFYTPSYHSMHHARYHGHYGLYTTVLDRWLNTYFEDYPAIYDRARAGEGLEQLNETHHPGNS